MRLITLHILSIIIVTFVTPYCLSQSSVEGSVDPYPGDSLYSLVDNLPSRISVGPPGVNQVWDFVNLRSPFVRKLSYQGDSSATSLVIDRDNVRFGYVKHDGALYLSHIANADPLLIGKPVTFQCSPDLLEFKNPIKYNDASSEYSRFIAYLPVADLPAHLRIDSMSVQDSLRIVLEVNRDDAVDAWGTLLMQNESFEVVRMRRVEEQLLKINVRNSVGRWVDVTPHYQTVLKGITWSSITYSYLFVTEGLPGPVAEVYTDENDEVERVIFSADPKMAEEISPNKRLYGVYVYPNPSFGDVRFEFFNIPDGNYELRVSNILGRSMWTKEFDISNDKVLSADLSFLRRGSYFYSLIDDTGKRVVTRRLIIIKP